MKWKLRTLFEAHPEIHTPLTSLIDVVFLLIIFFMFNQFKRTEGELVARLPRESGVVPSAIEVERIAPSEIRVRLGLQAGVAQYEINEEKCRDRKAFEMEFVRRSGGAAEKDASQRPLVVIDFADEVPVGVTVWVFDFAKSIGLEDVSFAMPEPKGGAQDAAGRT
jgi:biopolymer transport protein ExbD